ncbi:unnamed protein product, partial [Symbiodinium sp. CCMP2456]
MPGMWMRRAVTLMLGAGTHAAVVLQKNTYETSGCTGQVVRTEYMVTGCVQNGGGSGFAAVSCNSTGASLAMHTDAACAGNTTEEQSFDLSTCIDEYNKYMSCTEQTVVCVDGNTSDALPDGWFAYQGSCSVQ